MATVDKENENVETEETEEAPAQEETTLRPPPSDDNNGVAIVFPIPENVRRHLVQPGGTPASDLHLTLGYLGQVDEVDVSQRILQMIVQNLEADGLIASLNGIARFNGDTLDPIVALVDVPGVSEVRTELERLLAEDNVELNNEHGYNPHITLGYVGRDDQTPHIRLDDLEFPLSRPTVWWGEERQNEIEAHNQADEEHAEAIQKIRRDKERAQKIGSKECHDRARNLLAKITGVEEKSLSFSHRTAMTVKSNKSNLVLRRTKK